MGAEMCIRDRYKPQSLDTAVSSDCGLYCGLRGLCYPQSQCRYFFTISLTSALPACPGDGDGERYPDPGYSVPAWVLGSQASLTSLGRTDPGYGLAGHPGAGGYIR